MDVEISFKQKPLSVPKRLSQELLSLFVATPGRSSYLLAALLSRGVPELIMLGIHLDTRDGS